MHFTITQWVRECRCWKGTQLYFGGNYNVAIGRDAGESILTVQSTFVGYTAEYNNTTGTGNVTLGYNVLNANTSGIEM